MNSISLIQQVITALGICALAILGAAMKYLIK
jgi:hypothetical protein